MDWILLDYIASNNKYIYDKLSLEELMELPRCFYRFAKINKFDKPPKEQILERIVSKYIDFDFKSYVFPLNFRQFIMDVFWRQVMNISIIMNYENTIRLIFNSNVFSRILYSHLECENQNIEIYLENTKLVIELWDRFPILSDEGILKVDLSEEYLKSKSFYNLITSKYGNNIPVIFKKFMKIIEDKCISSSYTDQFDFLTNKWPENYFFFNIKKKVLKKAYRLESEYEVKRRMNYLSLDEYYFHEEIIDIA